MYKHQPREKKRSNEEEKSGRPADLFTKLWQGDDVHAQIKQAIDQLDAKISLHGCGSMDFSAFLMFRDETSTSGLTIGIISAAARW